jgi:hypothetical protein
VRDVKEASRCLWTKLASYQGLFQAAGLNRYDLPVHNSRRKCARLVVFFCHYCMENRVSQMLRWMKRDHRSKGSSVERCLFKCCLLFQRMPYSWKSVSENLEGDQHVPAKHSCNTTPSLEVLNMLSRDKDLSVDQRESSIC